MPESELFVLKGNVNSKWNLSVQHRGVKEILNHCCDLRIAPEVKDGRVVSDRVVNQGDNLWFPNCKFNPGAILNGLRLGQMLPNFVQDKCINCR